MKKKTVLIVDDDVRNIFALAATLRAKSFDVASSGSAREALALLRTNPEIDAVLIDMMMPEMDGYEAIPLIREIPSHADTLIVAVTAQAMPGDREKCLSAGAGDYISKPVDVDYLLELLKNA